MSDTATTDEQWEASAATTPAATVNPDGSPAEPVDPPTAPDEAPSTDGDSTDDGDTAPEAPATEASAEPVKRTRKQNPRGWLAASVLTICNDFLGGEIPAADADGKATPLTPHRVALLVKEREGREEAPSTGAVAAVFHRWAEYGFATFSEKPLAFQDFTDEGREKGLTAILDERKEARSAARAASKPAPAPAPAPAGADDAPSLV